MARKTTTPAEEDVELYSDAWRRFKRAIRMVAKKAPIHRQGGELVGADRPQNGRGRPRKNGTVS